MATPSRFSLTGWNSTYLAPRTARGNASAAPAAAAPVATTPGVSGNSVGSMSANVPAALQEIIGNANQSDAVRALSEALQLSLATRNQGAGQSDLSGLADLLNAQSLADQRANTVKLIGSAKWLQDRAKYAMGTAPYGSFSGLSNMATKQAGLEDDLGYQRTLERDLMPVLGASASAPGVAPRSGWVSQSLVR